MLDRPLMRRIRVGGIVLMVVAIAAANPGASRWISPVARGVNVARGSAEQQALARWAAGRFERAGLEPPAVEIHFDGDESGCGGSWGSARDGRVDVCTTLVNTMTRKILLHEMGHVWLDQNVTGPTREEFLRVRNLSSWSALGDPWRERGFEQAAEILAWGLGEGILTAGIPDNDAESLQAAFELLTGQVGLVSSLRTSAAADTSVEPRARAVPSPRLTVAPIDEGLIVSATGGGSLMQERSSDPFTLVDATAGGPRFPIASPGASSIAPASAVPPSAAVWAWWLGRWRP